MIARSPLAPDAFPELPAVAGVDIGVAETGLKYKGRPDLLLMRFIDGTQVAGVFTRSLCPSAPVDWCRQHLAGGEARGVVVNAGNANAFTGKSGAEACEAVVAAAADALTCRPSRIFAASTGVIGEVLPASKLTPHIEAMAADMAGDRWSDAATAIMTTDTFPKGATRRVDIGGTTVRINGIVKGSGMIAPDMATMLAFIATDAAIPADVLQACLSAATDKSFNCSTVDSDTSTSDTVLAFATGQAANPEIKDADDPALAAFRAALDDICVDLAKQVVRDGEGASKFITINVTGADSDQAAKRIALSIANSPLVKTAIAGEDANWGRVVMAVGKAGEKAERDRLSISMGGTVIAKEGAAVEGYDEGPVAAHMKGQEIDVDVDLALGDGKATVWTCDLTHGYISINADYRS
ncbi:MAG: bifunctional glutamate N-acetyltransferase/amino-acid acetyltransferase ArgJ [Rhodospirillales bacterium]|nr:bifunctional glutamate N-acetyltransferase/amino-acid acetyltransferase ArgJ [Rhodospirillales bacterium]MBO6786130.1 bifunctional glutamate N-acetyltransferase/amino-acid acetyltransferase ArgJ [Rhodospirillales bacterium]